MGFRILPSRLTQRFRTDLQTLFCRRIRGGPSISERTLALDRIAGSVTLLCLAGLAVWLVNQTLPGKLLRIPAVSERAEAAAGTPDFGLPTAGATLKPLSFADVRAVQAKLQSLGFDPGAVDGIAGRRTLKALNGYRATQAMEPTAYVDRATIAGLLD